MSGRIDGQDRDVFRGLVDVILPAGSGMPAGNEVGVADAGLDAVLDVRPDIVADVLRAIRLVRETPDAVDSMQETDPDGWRALRTAAFGAYYMSERVKAAIGYTGQLANPVDPEEKPEYMNDGTIDAVLARGPIWRPAPR
jgi:hypothetical protein